MRKFLDANSELGRCYTFSHIRDENRIVVQTSLSKLLIVIVLLISCKTVPPHLSEARCREVTRETKGSVTSLTLSNAM